MPLLNLQNEIEVKRYEDFVQNNPYGRATQSIAWHKVKSNWEPYYIYLENENHEITASMLVLTIKTATGKKLAYAPKGPVCAWDNPANVTALFDEAEKYLDTDELIMLRCDPEVLYSEELTSKYQQAGFNVRNLNIPDTIQPSLNMVLKLPNSEDELMQQFSSSTRNKIRKSARKGVKCVYSYSDEALDYFYNVHQIMGERQGISIRPKEYFKAVLESFGKEHARVYLAYDEDEVLAVAIALNYGDTVWYMYGGSTNNKRNLMPTYLIQYEMMKWGLETGKKYYDFGGIHKVDLDDGLYYFKSRFVQEPTRYIGEIDRIYDQEKYQEFNSK